MPISLFRSFIDPPSIAACPYEAPGRSPTTGPRQEFRGHLRYDDCVSNDPIDRP